MLCVHCENLVIDIIIYFVLVHIESNLTSWLFKYTGSSEEGKLIMIFCLLMYFLLLLLLQGCK